MDTTSVSDDAPQLWVDDVCDDKDHALEEDDVHYDIRCALEEDNGYEFVKLVKKLKSKEDLKKAWIWIYIYDSVKCADAVLAGEIDGVDLSFGLSGVGWTPLHACASIISPRLTAMLLNHGFAADTRSKCAYLDLEEPLPLNVALRQFRYFADTRKGRRNSVIKLVMDLCDSPMRNNLAVVRLLTQNTKEVKHEFYNYLKHGKMVEVAVLLLVAYRQLLPLSIPRPEGEDLVCNNMGELYEFLYEKKKNWESGKVLKDKLAEMEGTLLFLNIFDRIGDELVSYVVLPFNKESNFERRMEVATLLRSGGFDVKEDQIYESDSISRSCRATFNRMVLRTGPPTKCDKTYCSNRAMSSLGKMHGLEALGRRSFHTLSSTKVESNFAHFTPIGRSVNVVPILKPCARWAFFVSALKRGLRHV